MARPRCSGADTATATAFAVGIKRPAASAIRTRAATRWPKLSEKPAERLARAKLMRANKRRVLRSKLLKSTARIGEPIAYVRANTVASCPATAAEIPRSADSIGSSPVSRKVSVPIAKADNANQKRIIFRRPAVAKATRDRNRCGYGSKLDGVVDVIVVPSSWEIGGC